MYGQSWFVCQCMVNLGLPINVWSILVCLSMYTESWFACQCMVNLGLPVNVWSILVCLSMYDQSWFACQCKVGLGLPVNIWSILVCLSLDGQSWFACQCIVNLCSLSPQKSRKTFTCPKNSWIIAYCINVIHLSHGLLSGWFSSFSANSYTQMQGSRVT